MGCFIANWKPASYGRGRVVWASLEISRVESWIQTLMIIVNIDTVVSVETRR